MEKRRIDLIIEGNCEDCPFCERDEYYDSKKDSGWDCMHPDTSNIRIANDWEWNRYHDYLNKLKEVEENNKNKLFEIEDKPEEVIYPLNFPNWCPLEKVYEKFL